MEIPKIQEVITNLKIIIREVRNSDTEFLTLTIELPQHKHRINTAESKGI